MEAKYTNGPWETGALATQVVVQPENWRVPMLIADCHANAYSPESETERVANARLIASAPELFEALEDCEDALTHAGPCQCCNGTSDGCTSDEGHEDNCLVLRVRQAIAKARGEK